MSMYGGDWPSWSTPEREISVLRAAIHAMAKDLLEIVKAEPSASPLPSHVFHEKQAIVDYYIAVERGRE